MKDGRGREENNDKRRILKKGALVRRGNNPLKLQAKRLFWSIWETERHKYAKQPTKPPNIKRKGLDEQQNKDNKNNNTTTTTTIITTKNKSQ